MIYQFGGIDAFHADSMLTNQLIDNALASANLLDDPREMIARSYRALEKIEVTLQLDRLQRLCYKLDSYLQQKGFIQRAIIWVSQQTRFVNIHRILSQVSLIIERMKDWYRVDHEIKQKIVQIERIIEVDLKTEHSLMDVIQQIVTELSKQVDKVDQNNRSR